MLNNILNSLFFAVIFPTAINVINGKFSGKNFKLDAAYLLKAAIVFLVATLAFTLLDYI